MHVQQPAKKENILRLLLDENTMHFQLWTYINANPVHTYERFTLFNMA